MQRDRQVDERMASEQLEHVVEEPDARAHLGPPLAVEVERQPDVGLARLTHDLGGAWGSTQGRRSWVNTGKHVHRSRSIVEPVIHDSWPWFATLKITILQNRRLRFRRSR